MDQNQDQNKDQDQNLTPPADQLLEKSKKSIKELIVDTSTAVWKETKELFSLHLDTDKAGTIEGIRKSIEFRGGNLWALIFASLIASVGLNMNSAAVIIGAMLISPLMGPIVGVGYSVGTNDFETLKHSFQNLLLSVGVSIFAATLYFLLSPIKLATPELEARMFPTLYDILIAVFGGTVGIVASSRTDRGNAVPGVAIATALMPPLCTIGYGIAIFDFKVFGGALYLFVINSVFIALTAALFVRSLGFPKKEFLDAKREKNVRILIGALVTITVVPSIITAYVLITDTVFKSRVQEFITANFESTAFNHAHPKTTFLKHEINDSSYIEIILLGDPLPESAQITYESELPNYSLKNSKIIWHQNEDFRGLINQANKNNGWAPSQMEQFFSEKNQAISKLQNTISTLQNVIAEQQAKEIKEKKVHDDQITKIVKTVFPEVNWATVPTMSLRNSFEESDSLPGGLAMSKDTIYSVIVNIQKGEKINSKERQRMLNLLEIETGHENIELIIQ